MKLTILALLLGVIQASASWNTSGQNLTIEVKNETIREVIKKIETQTNYRFFYNVDFFDLDKTISLNAKDKPVKDILKELFSGLQVSYKFLDANLVVIAPISELQQFTVTGNVSDASTGESLPGVSIQVEGTTSGTVSDDRGNYSIPVPGSNVVLVFSYVGYISQRIEVANQNTLNVKLEPNYKNLEDVVVVGYGTQSKRSITGSVASVGYDKFKDRSNSNIMQSIAGELPGVSITQSQGAPGQSPIIKIRGSSSITAGTTPLFVIDGLPMENFNLNMINPQDIESVEILKDASSAAIYGSRGANGVILITTRLGKPGKTLFSATYEYGTQKVTRMVDMMNAQQYIQYYITAHNNAWISADPATHKATDPNSARGGNGNSSYAIPPDFINNPGQFGNGTNWQDVLFRTAPSHNLQLSVSGGTDKTQYLISGAYLNQEAVLDNNYYKRLTVRTNIKQKLSARISVGANLSFTGIFDRTDGTLGKADVVSLALQNNPIFPVYNENGNYGFKDPNSTWNRFTAFGDMQLWHPYSLTREINKQNKTFNSIGTAFVELEIIKNLIFRSSLDGNLNNIRYNSYQNANQKYGYSTANPAEGYTSSTYMFNWATENTLQYEKQFGDHTIKALLGYTAQKQRDEYSLLYSKNFPNDLVQTLNAGTANSGTSVASEWSMLSYLGRLNYNYRNKYYVTGTLRNDGSSRFGSNNKWGYFPSVSAGWLVSEEAFMKRIKTISNLKLRASYGLTGNNQIPNYGAISLLGGTNTNIVSTSINSNSSPSGNYVFGNTIANGLLVTSIANPDLRWEKTAQFDLGIELGILNNRLNFTAEYYNSITKDLLLNLPIPDITGFSTQLTNIGKLRNRGFELGINSRNLVGKFTWTTDFNFSLNRNKVLQLGPDAAPIIYTEWNTSVKTEVGQPLSNFYGYKFIGVYNNQAQIDASPHVAAAVPGDPIIKDVNGDNIISPADRTTLGNAQPDYIAGMTNTFTFKGIEFSVMLQGSYGNEIVNQQVRYDGLWNAGRNLYADVSHYWKSESDPGDGKHFRPTTVYQASQNEFSSYWVEDGSYLRIKNIRLSYNLPPKLLARIGIQATRVYINVENAYLFTKYTGYDPENTTYNATTYSAASRAVTGTTTVATDTYNNVTSTASFPTGAMLGIDFGSYPVPRVITFGVKLDF